MAEGTVLQLQVLKLFMQGFVLAHLASVVLLLENALATGDAGAVVGPTVAARNIAKKRLFEEKVYLLLADLPRTLWAA